MQRLTLVDRSHIVILSAVAAHTTTQQLGDKHVLRQRDVDHAVHFLQ